MQSRTSGAWLRLSAAAAVALMLVTPIPAPGQGVPTLTELSAAHERVQADLESRRQTDRTAALDQYGVYLEMAMRLLQQRGDLEGYLAVERENGAFARDRTIPDQDEPGVHPHVATGRTAGRAARMAADARHAAALKEAWARYAAQLEALKRHLTRQGQIPEAMAASEAQARAQATLAKLEPPPTATVKHASGGEAERPCPRCQGTGKTSAACEPCSGSGRCRSCQGTGRRPNPMKGTATPVTCLPCKGGGKCGPCGGTGRGATAGACPECGGTGAIRRRATPAPDGPALTSRPVAAPDGPPPPPSITAEAAGRELQSYVQAMEALRRKFDTETPEAVDAATVAAAPGQQVGRLLASRVFLVSAFARNATVSTARGGGETLSLIPYTKEQGLAAQEILRARGAGATARIVYGVVNAQNLTLFQIEPD